MEGERDEEANGGRERGRERERERERGGGVRWQVMMRHLRLM